MTNEALRERMLSVSDSAVGAAGVRGRPVEGAPGYVCAPHRCNCTHVSGVVWIFFFFVDFQKAFGETWSRMTISDLLLFFFFLAFQQSVQR